MRNIIAQIEKTVDMKEITEDNIEQYKDVIEKAAYLYDVEPGEVLDYILNLKGRRIVRLDDKSPLKYCGHGRTLAQLLSDETVIEFIHMITEDIEKAQPWIDRAVHFIAISDKRAEEFLRLRQEFREQLVFSMAGKLWQNDVPVFINGVAVTETMDGRTAWILEEKIGD